MGCNEADFHSPHLFCRTRKLRLHGLHSASVGDEMWANAKLLEGVCLCTSLRKQEQVAAASLRENICVLLFNKVIKAMAVTTAVS